MKNYLHDYFEGIYISCMPLHYCLRYFLLKGNSFDGFLLQRMLLVYGMSSSISNTQTLTKLITMKNRKS